VAGPVGALDGLPALRLRHRAEPAEMGRMRARLTRWAVQQAVPEDVLIDLQLAVGEAVANGVEHAYRDGEPGTVDVDLALMQGPQRERVLSVRVADHGRWRPAPRAKGYRGRGRAMIHQLAEHVVVSATSTGTQVCFEIPFRG
jgi:serine/threonine-protein kinase RsbW